MARWRSINAACATFWRYPGKNVPDRAGLLFPVFNCLHYFLGNGTHKIAKGVEQQIVGC